jgi:SAM-dependent methyltransferase
MSMHRCQLCDEDTIRPWFVRTVSTQEYPIVRCSYCKSAYVWPRPQAGAVQDIYSDSGYNPAHSTEGMYKPTAQQDVAQLFASFGHFIAGKALIDIGAGTGIASEEAIRRGFAVRACEPSPQCRKEYLNRNGFEPEAAFFDAAYCKENPAAFDAVLLSHVLEHIADPEQALNNARKVLRSGGVAIIAVPLFGSILTSVMGRRDFFLTPPEHLTYFSCAGLAKLLERTGYQIEASYTSSKVNMLRYRSRFGAGSYAINMAVYGLLRVSELFKRSIVLNVCARRID